MTSHASASRAAAVCVAALAGAHLLGAAQAAGDTGDRVGGLALGGALLATAVGIARGNRFGARLAAVVICALDLVALALVVSVGPPGEAREPLDLAHAAVGVLAAAVLALIAVDARGGRDRPRRDDTPPYAL
jgi:peptidoglycan/LPS O-acetylase OafA/YrhL